MATVSVEQIAMIVGKVLDAQQERRTRDSLHALLMAHQEQQATMAHAIQELREEFKDARADYKSSLLEAVKRLGESNPKADELDSSEFVRQCVGEITSGLSRHEHWARKLVGIMQDIATNQEIVARAVTEFGRAREEPLRPVLSVVRSGVSPGTNSILEKIDNEEED